MLGRINKSNIFKSDQYKQGKDNGKMMYLIYLKLPNDIVIKLSIYY